MSVACADGGPLRGDRTRPRGRTGPFPQRVRHSEDVEGDQTANSLHLPLQEQHGGWVVASQPDTLSVNHELSGYGFLPKKSNGSNGYRRRNPGMFFERKSVFG